MDKKGFINPLLPIETKRGIREQLSDGNLEMEEMIVAFISEGYRVTFKNIGSSDATGVNITTDNKKSGNSEWILSDFHDTPSEAVARCWHYHFIVCDKQPWLDAYCTVHTFDR